MGRQKVPEEKALLHELKTRVTTRKYNELQRILAQNPNMDMSSLLRDFLENRTIKVFTHDLTLDNLMEELANLRMEIKAIGGAKTFDVKGFIAGRKQGYTEKRGTKVTQYDVQGNPIAYYLSLQEAGKAVNGHWTSISAVIRGERKTACGYRWKKGHHERKIKPLAF